MVEKIIDLVHEFFDKVNLDLITWTVLHQMIKNKKIVSAKER